MHFLLGIAFVAGLIWFVWGEWYARAFIGATLTLGGLAVLLLIGIAVLNISRQESRVHVVHMESAR